MSFNPVYKNFEILKYSPDALAKSLVKDNEFLTPDEVKNKRHFIYFQEYLSNSDDGLGAKTIIIENDYISKAYLSDYSTYYSLCFKQYKRKAKRIHFFSETFNKQQFVNSLISTDVKNRNIWDSYLGFIVAKPLPDAIIGPTILHTYNSSKDKLRKYSCTRDYHVNVFGKELVVNTLIFQEQDTVLSACATAALWCAFHKTSDLFHTPEPSPSAITNSAGNLFINSGRTFPSHGLDPYQICRSIENIGLVSELRNKSNFLDDSGLVKSFIYGYLRMGLPVLLGIESSILPRHLITVNGYKEVIDYKNTKQGKMLLKAEFIERFYAHDDQVGPFCRLGFKDNSIVTALWFKDPDQRITAIASCIIVPLHPKIRITFEEVYETINYVDKFFAKFLSLIKSKIIWDIFLDFSNKYKEEVLSDKSINDNLKKQILFKNMPRFIWHAVAYINNEKIMDIIFDATDISRGFFCFDIIFYNESFKDLLKDILAIKKFQNYIELFLDRKFVNLFYEKLNIKYKKN